MTDIATNYLTTVKAAAWLGISPRRLDSYRVRGGGPAFHRFGRIVRYRLADLDDWRRSGGWIRPRTPRAAGRRIPRGRGGSGAMGGRGAIGRRRAGVAGEISPTIPARAAAPARTTETIPVAPAGGFADAGPAGGPEGPQTGRISHCRAQAARRRNTPPGWPGRPRYLRREFDEFARPDAIAITSIGTSIPISSSPPPRGFVGRYGAPMDSAASLERPSAPRQPDLFDGRGRSDEVPEPGKPPRPVAAEPAPLGDDALVAALAEAGSSEVGAICSEIAARSLERAVPSLEAV